MCCILSNYKKPAVVTLATAGQSSNRKEYVQEAELCPFTGNVYKLLNKISPNILCYHRRAAQVAKP